MGGRTYGEQPEQERPEWVRINTALQQFRRHEWIQRLEQRITIGRQWLVWRLAIRKWIASRQRLALRQRIRHARLSERIDRLRRTRVERRQFRKHGTLDFRLELT
jgi:hypothetical protein